MEFNLPENVVHLEVHETKTRRRRKSIREKTQVFHGGSEGQAGDFQNDNKQSPSQDTALLQLPAQWENFLRSTVPGCTCKLFVTEH